MIKLIIHDCGWSNFMAYLCNKPIYQLVGHHHWFVGPQVVVLIPGKQGEKFKGQNSSCYSFWLYKTQMVKMQGSDCLVYLNTMTQRGLIIPTVSKAWTLFKLHHNSKWVSDSKTALLRARLVTASAVFGTGVPHASLVLLSHRPWECNLKRSCDFPMNTGASPGKHRSWEAARENPEPPWLIPLHHFHHMQTHTVICTCTVQWSHTWHMGQVKVQSQLSGVLQNVMREWLNAALFPPQWKILLCNCFDGLCFGLCWGP